MKFLLYLLLALVVVPLSNDLAALRECLGVRPDLGLVAACLVGFLGGELDGLILGLVWGVPGHAVRGKSVWINVVTKGGSGFLAGLAGRHMAHITPAA